jgi:phosphoribosylaminoimidazolecarboxamide formyltransferase/IMP cyclohydrolase
LLTIGLHKRLDHRYGENPHQRAAFREEEAVTAGGLGSIAATDRPLSNEVAAAMRGIFYEVAIAPGYEPEALERLEKRRDLRILRLPPEETAAASRLDYRHASGGMLVQERGQYPENNLELRVVTRRAPARGESEDLGFARRAAKHVKSNGIVLARDRALLGMGTGQPNQVTSVHLALRAAGRHPAGRLRP